MHFNFKEYAWFGEHNFKEICKGGRVLIPCSKHIRKFSHITDNTLLIFACHECYMNWLYFLKEKL